MLTSLIIARHSISGNLQLNYLSYETEEEVRVLPHRPKFTNLKERFFLVLPESDADSNNNKHREEYIKIFMKMTTSFGNI